jgi:hypothetical protein
VNEPSALARQLRERTLARVDEELRDAFTEGSDWTVDQLCMAITRIALDTLIELRVSRWDVHTLDLLADALDDLLRDNRKLSVEHVNAVAQLDRAVEAVANAERDWQRSGPDGWRTAADRHRRVATAVVAALREDS